MINQKNHFFSSLNAKLTEINVVQSKCQRYAQRIFRTNLLFSYGKFNRLLTIWNFYKIQVLSIIRTIKIKITQYFTHTKTPKMVKCFRMKIQNKL